MKKQLKIRLVPVGIYQGAVELALEHENHVGKRQLLSTDFYHVEKRQQLSTDFETRRVH